MKQLLAIVVVLAFLPFTVLAADPAPPATRPATRPAPRPTTRPTTAPVVEVQADGSLLLKAEGARIHGFKLHLESRPAPMLMYWIDPIEYPEWPQAVAKKGAYAVELTYSYPVKGGTSFYIAAAANRVEGKAETTADWQTCTTVKLGTIHVLNDGTSISIHVGKKSRTVFIAVRSIKLTPVEDEPANPKDKKKR